MKKILLVLTVLSVAFIFAGFLSVNSKVEASENIEPIVKQENTVTLSTEEFVELLQRRYYGALAIDSNKGSGYGFAVNYMTQAAADDYALSQCGYGCQVIIRFYNTCAAYAADQTRGSTVYGWSQGNSGPSARLSAMNHCRSRGGKSCVVRVWGCTNRR